jgi:Uma2 family endonuclease
MSAAERLNYFPPLLSATFPRKYTVEEYLEIVNASEERLEYVNGYIVKAEMGGTYNHSTIGMNIAFALRQALKDKPCRVHGTDLRVKTKNSFRLPDALVICGEPQFHNPTKTTVTNPIILVEVVSPESSTRDYIDKRIAYFEIETLQHYMIIEQLRPAVTVYTRNSNGAITVADYDFNNPIIMLSDLGIAIGLEDIYEGVEFE